jgi:ATP-binding cassette subfamily F protein uup
MALVTLRKLSIGYRGPPLLDDVDCRIEPGQRIGLLGRNGSGKTTLLRMLAGEVQPDHGELILAPHARAALLPQDVPRELCGSVREIVIAGAAAADRHAAFAPGGDVEQGGDAEQHATAWQAQHRAEQTLSRMELDGEARFEMLSSGMKRRVLLARTLAAGPDLLLLDEPTNHLDIDAITWLEDFLSRWGGTLMFVTHDRVFLRKLAQRILEIDRGRLFDWSCDYDTFLARKEAALAAEEKQNALFDKKLAQEEVWIRTGIMARRTRNEGRVRALEKMRRERAARRDKPGSVQLVIQSGQRSGNLVARVDRISFGYPVAEQGGLAPGAIHHGTEATKREGACPPCSATGDQQCIVRDFSTTILRGDKLGVIGPNGAGKTTLLRLLLGQLAPDSGRVTLGTNLQIAYFDQLRGQLDESRTLEDNVGDGYDTVGVGDGKRHIVGYLRDFLFDADRARTPVKFLSGGERNRALLAKLFAKPANVIVLDEPTNDLDAETLELLEARLVEFPGTVLLVSHDREFLNNVVTSTIVFEHSGMKGGVKEYVGGYDDWLRQRPPLESVAASAKAVTQANRNASPSPGRSAEVPRRLKYKEQQELAGLPAAIEKLEAEIAALHDSMARPEFYQQSGEQIAQETARVKDLDARLAAAWQRWEELEALAE